MPRAFPNTFLAANGNSFWTRSTSWMTIPILPKAEWSRIATNKTRFNPWKNWIKPSSSRQTDGNVTALSLGDCDDRDWACQDGAEGGRERGRYVEDGNSFLEKAAKARKRRRMWQEKRLKGGYGYATEGGKTGEGDKERSWMLDINICSPFHRIPMRKVSLQDVDCDNYEDLHDHGNNDDWSKRNTTLTVATAILITTQESSHLCISMVHTFKPRTMMAVFTRHRMSRMPPE